MRLPLFFVREMRGKAHLWELDSPHCLSAQAYESREGHSVCRGRLLRHRTNNKERDQLLEGPDNG